MRRVRKIVNGSNEVEFCVNALYVEEDAKHKPYITETAVASDGSIIVWETAKTTEYITVTSKKHGWVDETDAITLKEWYAGTDELVVHYTDTTTVTTIPAHEKQMDIAPIFEGSENFRIVLPLRKV